MSMKLAMLALLAGLFLVGNEALAQYGPPNQPMSPAFRGRQAAPPPGYGTSGRPLRQPPKPIPQNTDWVVAEEGCMTRNIYSAIPGGYRTTVHRRCQRHQHAEQHRGGGQQYSERRRGGKRVARAGKKGCPGGCPGGTKQQMQIHVQSGNGSPVTINASQLGHDGLALQGGEIHNRDSVPPNWSRQ